MQTPSSGKKTFQCLFTLLFVVLSVLSAAHAQTATPLRRPISPSQPMWLIHIDTWNYADPQKIIALIPPDIRPFVVMNISLSISHNEQTSQFQVAEYGYEVAKSWLRACAENRMWAMVQPSSGGFSQFSDFDLAVYHEFYREYPNFIGFNYCEQFWGYDIPTDPLSTAWTARIRHFANLLELSHQYGGYLVVSWCGNQWSPNINPIGMLKRIPAFATACRDFTENYILCEKYTQQAYQSDMESLCLGAWLSGYAGQYGIRYDDTGWTDSSGNHAGFTMASYGAPFLEHVMLTGQTVIDAPELIWTQCFRELSTAGTTDGYTQRRWGTFPQFENVSVDLFRKVLDGTVRIPSRAEVIDRTKVAIINDVNSGNADTIYSSPDTLFEGLYRMDGDGNLRDNKTFFKKTGRYPTVPTVYQLDDAEANSFQIKVNRSGYASRWPTVAAKVNEFDTLFPQESTGDLYAGRHENGWVVYNPYKTGQTASGSIPFRYNTCERMDLNFSQYTAGVVKEEAGQLSFYLSNYDNALDTGLKTNTITIHGATTEPSWSHVERGDHQPSVISKSWIGGVFSLTVQHNGALDITVNCSGTATGRLTDYTPAAISAPALPAAFPGPRQYEAECFDYKSIAGTTNGGQNGDIRNYRGQGYLQFGTNAAAAVRDHISVLSSGVYRLDTRYSVTGGDRGGIDLYVNGTRVAGVTFPQTATFSDWAILEQDIELNAGTNTIEFRATATGSRTMYFDSITVAPTTFDSGLVIQENEAGFGGVEGVIGGSPGGFTGEGFADTDDVAGTGIDWWLDFPAANVGAFTFRYASLEDRVADLYVNGIKVASDVTFRSTGSLTEWKLVTAHGAVSEGLSRLRLQAVSSSGLPNIDFLGIGGESGTESIEPVADVYVRDGGSADTNFGTSDQLVAKFDANPNSGFTRYTYLKFDVDGLADTLSATLKLVPFQVDGGATLAIERLEDDAWSETGMTFNNQLTETGTPATSSTGFVVGQQTSVDLTNVVRTEAAGDGVLSLRISNDGWNFIGFGSRESATAALRPVLEYTVANPTAIAGAVKKAHLRFDEATGTAAADSTGNGWNGTLSGSPTWEAGRIAGALDLSGDSQVSLPDGVFADLDDFTIGFWLKTETISDEARFFDFSTGTATNRMTFTPRTSAGVMRFAIAVDGTAQFLEAPLGIQFTAGAWMHVTVTKAGENTTLYIDGDPVAASSNFTHKPSDLGVTTENHFGSDPAFTGTVDDFRIYQGALGAFDVARLATPPPAVVNLTALTFNSRVTLDWTAAAGATSYTIRRSLLSGGPYETVGTVTTLSFEDTTVTNGTTYYYVVAASNGIAEGSSGSEVGATPKAFEQSGGIVSMEAENGYLGSRWITTANTGASNSAFLQVNPVHNSTGGEPEGTTPEFLASYPFNIATAGNHRFWFRVFAANADDDSFFWRIDGGDWTLENGRVGHGTWYSVDSGQLDNLASGGHVLDIAYRENGTGLDKFVIQPDGTTSPVGNGPEETVLPAAPSGLSATAVQASRIDLAWSPSPGAAAYMVKRSTSDGGPFTTIASSLTETTFIDAPVSAGTTFHYIVIASNEVGESAASAQASAKALALPISAEELRAPSINLEEGSTNITTAVSVEGHFYQLQSSGTLAADTWQIHGEAKAGTGGPLVFVIPVDPDADRRFYRLLIIRP